MVEIAILYGFCTFQITLNLGLFGLYKMIFKFIFWIYDSKDLVVNHSISCWKSWISSIFISTNSSSSVSRDVFVLCRESKGSLDSLMSAWDSLAL